MYKIVNNNENFNSYVILLKYLTVMDLCIRPFRREKTTTVVIAVKIRKNFNPYIALRFININKNA